MKLDLLQIASGTVTFAEPGRSSRTANDGVLFSIPVAEWISRGCPSGLLVTPVSASHSGDSPGSVEPAPESATQLPQYGPGTSAYL